MSNPRFAALTKNIRTRRGRQIEVRLPADTAAEGAGLEPAASAQLRGAHASAVVDCMAFGMGCGCLQTTYQLQGAQHALWLHDALAVLAPLTLALRCAPPPTARRCPRAARAHPAPARTPPFRAAARPRRSWAGAW